MRVLDVPQKARRLLVRSGWCKHAFHVRGAYCSIGAIRKAATGAAHRQNRASEAATSLVEGVVGYAFGLAPWNDDRKRRKAHVIAAFDAAIAKARKRVRR